MTELDLIVEGILKVQGQQTDTLKLLLEAVTEMAHRLNKLEESNK